MEHFLYAAGVATRIVLFVCIIVGAVFGVGMGTFALAMKFWFRLLKKRGWSQLSAENGAGWLAFVCVLIVAAWFITFFLEIW